MSITNREDEERYGKPQFCFSIEEYDMADKKSYTAVLSSLETHIHYIKENLGEIKEHLGKINGHLDDHSYRLKQAEDDIETERLLGKERRRTSKKAIVGYFTGSVAILIALLKAFRNGI